MAVNRTDIWGQDYPAYSPKYGFKVGRRYGDCGDLGVSLPHSCDSWVITDGGVDGDSLETSVADLESFIAEAQAALAVLRETAK